MIKAIPLTVRLLLSYLLVAALPLAGLAAFYLASFENLLRDTVLENMATIADKKVEQIDGHLSERLSNAKLLANRTSILDGMATLGYLLRTAGADTPDYQVAASRLRDTLEAGDLIGDYDDLLLIDPMGRLVFSHRGKLEPGADINALPNLDSPLAKGWDTTLKTSLPHLSRFAPFAPAGNRLTGFVTAPLIRNGVVSGVMALQLTPRTLEMVTANRTGLGETGETVLAQLDGSNIIYTAPLRHAQRTAFRSRTPLEKTSLPMQMALVGKVGRGVIRDYAGIESVAAWRHLPALGWGMVVKIDAREALAPAVRLRHIAYLALALFLILSGAVAYYFGRRLSRPIQRLTSVADRIAVGDFSRHAPLDGNGELGRLSRAFNHMTDALAESRHDLEAKVAERSQELREITALQDEILDKAGALVVVLDNEGRIRRFNHACEELTQHAFEEVEGRLIRDCFVPHGEGDPAHPAGFAALTLDAPATRSSFSSYWVARDGTRSLIEWSNAPLLDDAGRVKFMVCVGKDVTQKHSAEIQLKQSEQRLREAQRIARVGSWELDIPSGRLTWSDETFRLFEIDRATFSGTYAAFLAAIHPDDRNRVNEAYTQSLANHVPYETVHRLRMPDGRVKWVRERCETQYDAQGEARVSVGTVQDITERKQAMDSLRLYANVFEHSGEAILITDSNRRIMAVNPAFTRLTGYALDEIQGQNPRLLASGQTPEATYAAMWSALDETGFWQGEVIDRRKDNTLYPKWMSISVVRDSDGEVAHYIASFTDISARKEAEAQISQLAYHDTLTGLINRFSLQHQLDQALAMANREKHALAVIFLDLDRFKIINDTLGHAIGDKLLIEVAHRLQHTVRSSDIVARLGGDEFVIVLTSIEDLTSAARLADKIRQALAQRYNIGESEVHSTASLGIALFPNDGEDGETLMKNADTAMYHAKSQGRNNVQFFTAEMNEAAIRRMKLDNDLRMAVETGQFELHYQPQIDSRSGRAIGVEALVRWRHPRDGLLAPAEFIPLAEDTGMILQLGEWVLDEACRQLRAWMDVGLHDITMAVNLSAHQLHSPALLEHVAQALEKYGLKGSDLELEITETVAMRDPDASISQLKALRNLGVRLSIDDFGTGYSSLSYLKLLPIHTLKLDKSFVHDIETDSNDVAICTATIALAHNLGLAVIAEGVETEAQRLLLTSHQCDFMQGYLFSKPLPEKEALAFMQVNHPG